MFDFVNNIGDAEIDSYLTDSSATIDRLGLGFSMKFAMVRLMSVS